MNRELIQTAEKYNKKHSRKKTWHRIVGILGCVVVFCTSYALILPAITMSRDAYCGHEEHEHTAACYGAVTVTEPICSPETLGLHVHGAECFDAAGALLCQQSDSIAHIHDESCYSADGTLWCTLAEVSGHVHTDACYATVEITPASDPHVHTETCYTAQQGQLTCTEEEREGHAHSEACYTSQQGELTCTLAEDENHTHEAACYAWSDVLTCTLTEDAGHAHGESCYLWEQVLSCGLDEGEIIPAQTEQQLVCTLSEEVPHVHGESCFHTVELPPQTEEPTCGMEVHTHSLACWSDPTADVENRSDWEATLPAALSGNAAEDVLSIAASQLGYRESELNYTVLDDGETMLGYTRYGDWYGVPYGDWCAMFVSFCLDYANVTGMPLHSAVRPWIEELDGLELYHDAEGYLPQSGDLIFFDWEVDGKADHVGLVVEATQATEDLPAQVKTIEGNSSNCVQNVTYRMDDAHIFGYASLPAEKEIIHYLCGVEGHAHGENCYDAEGVLTCQITEHIHDEQCMERTVFYTDPAIRAFVTISGVKELPADLQLELWQVSAETEPATYAAMQTALGEQMEDSPYFISAASFYQMQLLSGGEVYELSDEAQVKVNVEFTQSAFDAATLDNAVDTQAFTLTPDAAAQQIAEAEIAGETTEPQPLGAEGSLSGKMEAVTLNTAAPEETGSYEASTIEDTQTAKDQDITSLSFVSGKLTPFAVMASGTVQTGTFWERVDSTADITSGGTYMIVSAEGNYALRGNSSSNYAAVTISGVKGNTDYYTITGSDDAMLRWTFTGSGSTYTIQCQGGSKRYLRLNNDTFISSTSATTTLSYHDAENCWRLYYDTSGSNNDYYLRNTGGGAFARVRNNPGRDDSGTGTSGQSTNYYYTRDMLIFKLSDVTSLEIPDDVLKEEVEGDNGQSGPPKPDYDDFIDPTDSLTGATAVTDSQSNATVEGSYYSDPATSDIEAGFRYSDPATETERTYAQHELLDGKVVTDKSVIYGKDDYGAFDEYAPNTFSVSLSALGQEYEVPYQYIVKTPVDVVFILDVSGSMSANAYQNEIRAQAVSDAFNSSVTAIMNQHPANRIGMVMYSTGAWEILPLDRYTASDSNNDGIKEFTTTSKITKYNISDKYYVYGSSSLKTESGVSYANAGRYNDVNGTEIIQGVGTFTQGGIAMGEKVFRDIGNDTTYTATMGEGETAMTQTVKRQPVFILLSDGEPTHATSNYMDPLSGPFYGDGRSDTRSENPKGVMGYYTILSANYSKRIVAIQYNKPALFYTIGMGIKGPNDANDDTGYTTTATGDRYKRAVLNPDPEIVEKDSFKSSTNNQITAQMLKQLLMGTYTSRQVDVDSTWPDIWMGVPHKEIPALLDNPYADNYNYTDQSYFGQMTANDLEQIFTDILQNSLKETPYGFILFRNSSVNINDTIGEGMEIKGTPVLRYNGINYTDPTVTTAGNVTTYVYEKEYEDPYIPNRIVDISEIIVTVTTEANGQQTVEMLVPDTALPTFTPELEGMNYYYEMLPVRLIYQVGLTAEAEQDVLDLRKTGGKLVYYTNDFTGTTPEDIVPDAVSTLHPSLVNPFYHEQELEDGSMSVPQYHAHHTLKTDNPTDTAEYHVDCTLRTYTVDSEDGQGKEEAIEVIHLQGNNGKLVFEVDATDIPVEKNWIGFEEDEKVEIDVTLYLVTQSEGVDGSISYEASAVTTAKLNAENQWKHTFASLRPTEENQFLAIAETVPVGCQVKYTGETVTIPGADGAPVKAAKVDFTDPDNVLITITNSPGVLLPNTGGIGITPYTIIGLTLMLVSSVFLLHSRRRRREAR